jgi:hypothetical protein
MFPTSATQGHTLAPTVVIRRATAAEAPVVEQLAALDSSRAPRGDVLLALVDGAPWAALSVADGHAVANPFRPSAEAVDLLRIRAAQLRDEAPAGRRRAVRRVLWLSRASA